MLATIGVKYYRSDQATCAPAWRGGDRTKRSMSAHGTKRTSWPVRLMSAFGADRTCRSSGPTSARDPKRTLVCHVGCFNLINVLVW